MKTYHFATDAASDGWQPVAIGTTYASFMQCFASNSMGASAADSGTRVRMAPPAIAISTSVSCAYVLVTVPFHPLCSLHNRTLEAIFDSLHCFNNIKEALSKAICNVCGNKLFVELNGSIGPTEFGVSLSTSRLVYDYDSLNAPKFEVATARCVGSCRRIIRFSIAEPEHTSR